MTTIKTGTSLIASAALLSACAFLVITDQPAFAETRAQTSANDFAFDFDYAQKELQSRDGANAMLTRLQNKVRRECRSENRTTLAERRLTQACINATMEKTVRDIGSTALATAYENRTDG